MITPDNLKFLGAGFLATPATQISLIKVVSYGSRQEKSHENVKEITRLDTALFQRLSARKLSSLGLSQEEEITPMEPVNGGTRTMEFQEETCV
jgi:hypothetical protein